MTTKKTRMPVNSARSEPGSDALAPSVSLEPKQFTADDDDLMHRLEVIATKLSDGHFTVMRFTTNWRIGFTTPDDWFEVGALASGPTFADAARAAIADAEMYGDGYPKMMDRADDAARPYVTSRPSSLVRRGRRL